MSDSMKINGPVSVTANCKERVAFELMEKISGWEDIDKLEKKNRDYWLDLYTACLEATSYNRIVKK